MDSRWFKGISGVEAKEARKKELSAFKRAYEELAVLLEAEITEEAPDYDCPSWSHKQADRNGFNRGIRTVLKLIQQ